MKCHTTIEKWQTLPLESLRVHPPLESASYDGRPCTSCLQVSTCRDLCAFGREDVVVSSVCRTTCGSPYHYGTILDPEDPGGRYTTELETDPDVS